MTDPIRIPLSVHQQATFATIKAQGIQFDAAVNALNGKLNAALEAIIGGVVDPTTVATWQIQYEGAEIVCTPPAEPPKPKLVPDIGHDGVSDAAAPA